MSEKRPPGDFKGKLFKDGFMPLPIMFFYGLFLLALAAILIFTGPAGRRHLVLALACGGVITFILPFVYAGLGGAQLFTLQLVFFPFLVLSTWGTLFLVSRLKNR